MKPHDVEIVLPTYNGAKYLGGLLDSLAAQTYRDFTLITYDDGSADDSIRIVDSYCDRISILRIANPDRDNMGASASFAHLLSQCSGDCIMLCDQDDIWEPHKVEKGRDAMKTMQKNHGDVPLLFFSDLAIIGADGSTIAPSFNKYHRFDLYRIGDPYYVCLKNPAPGCSMILNRLAVQASLPMESGAVMHDWWIIIITRLLGAVGYSREPWIRYRKHSSNTMGPIYDPPRPMFQLPESIGRTLRAHKNNIIQGQQAFRRCGRRFSIARYFLCLVKTRYLNSRPRSGDERPNPTPASLH